MDVECLNLLSRFYYFLILVYYCIKTCTLFNKNSFVSVFIVEVLSESRYKVPTVKDHPLKDLKRNDNGVKGLDILSHY